MKKTSQLNNPPTDQLQNHRFKLINYPVLMMLLIMFPVSLFAAVPYVNWENHPVHALDISPDKTRLAVAHTADNRVQLFDISLGYPVRLGHVKVGVDPVSVRFKNDQELWVVNHISDSVSVVDFDLKIVKATLATADEPFDLVFANNKAYVSCSQANQVLVFNDSDFTIEPEVIDLLAEDPRAMTVNSDGSQVYIASFESGNKTTIIGGGIDESRRIITFPPNAVNEASTPYAGINPPPNDGNQFTPEMSVDLPTAPKVSMIVRQNDAGLWLDDNGVDWTEFVSGEQAALSGRVEGWTLLDHDISVIDTSTHEVSYVSGLMNIGMAIGFNHANNEVTLVGTDASNEIRFEPVLNGKFLQVKMGTVAADALNSPEVIDLNPHLDYQSSSEPQAIRDQSVGDPRGVIWNQSGNLGYVAGMGSNNVIVISQTGARLAQIEVGEGATGLALDEANDRLYVWNHFAASLSTVELSSQKEINQTAVFNPLPEAITQGRQFLYGTHETSGLGQISCASCHVDGRMDRLAWDLGDPSGAVKIFNQNCQTLNAQFTATGCTDFHPMKGPMMTQTFQDIIGNEPFHWRGDRDGLEEFNGAFMSLNGDDKDLTAEQMQQFKAMLSTITFPPNPFRQIDNTLPESIDLKNHYTSGRFSAAGQPLGTGNPQKGLEAFNSGLLDGGFQCASCHTIPTGMAVNGPLLSGLLGFPVAGEILPTGVMDENHLGVVSDDGSTQKSFKTPQLRNLYEKVGFETSRDQSLSGFGFLHDGAVDSVARFLSTGVFKVQSDQEVADLVALMMAFSGSGLDVADVPLGNAAPESQDTHAGVGQQLTLTQATQFNVEVDNLMFVADSAEVDLIAQLGSKENYLYDPLSQQFKSFNETTIGLLGLMSQAANNKPLTLSLVAQGLGQRLAFDRDGDGIADETEIKLGSNPSDAESTSPRPLAGMWFNPQRSGHGMELQLSGDQLFIIWYTFNDDGSPVWYIAADQYSPNWSATLERITWNAASRTTDRENVGTAALEIKNSTQAVFSWDINGRVGAEDFQYFQFAAGPTIEQHTGSYFDPSDSGWGVSVFTQGETLATVLFYFDELGEPIWALGSGTNTSGDIQMYAYRGFCPDCTFVSTTNELVGIQNMTFLANGKMVYEVSIDSPNNLINWNSDDVTLSPISNRFFDPELQ